MPVAGMVTERPLETLPGESGSHLQILRHVLLVIVGKKALTQGGQVQQQSDQTEAKAYQNFQPRMWRRFIHLIIQTRIYVQVQWQTGTESERARNLELDWCDLVRLFDLSRMNRLPSPALAGDC